MKFKPFTQKYDFSNTGLTELYPSYIARPIGQWFLELADANNLAYNRNGALYGGFTDLNSDFTNRLGVLLCDTFPTDIDRFLAKMFDDSELTSNFLAILLQNFCNGSQAVRLEVILSDGGSAFAVEKTNKAASEYAKGVYDLIKRVPEQVKSQAEVALSSDQLINEAWQAFYSRNPDYSKTVSKCCDALEGILRDQYEPKNARPQLSMLLKNLEANPNKLNFKGDSLLKNKTNLLALVEKATTVRGMHKNGTGRDPTPEEANYILNVTILIWNLHQQI